MVHGSGELQEDHRTAAFEAGGQLDPRQPPIAGALAAQVATVQNPRAAGGRPGASGGSLPGVFIDTVQTSWRL
jgi:hypothetical protein